MNPRIEVISTPADQAALAGRDLSGVVCVVFDILRATSSIIAALANGAEAVLPAMEIPEALALRERFPDALLAGERAGLRIGAALTGGVEFDCGNSPREFFPGRVAGRRLVMTTTNGTRALRAATRSSAVFAGAFLNLSATARAVMSRNPMAVVLIGSGTHHEMAYEDYLACGAMADQLIGLNPSFDMCDATLAARDAHGRHADDLAEGLGRGGNGRRLLSLPDLAPDVAFCAQRDHFPILAGLASSGEIRIIPNQAAPR